MNLITVTDRWGLRVRINKDDFDNPARRVLPIYNRFGVKITDQRSYNPKKHSGQTHIIRENIVGTPEYEQSQKAVAALMAQWEAEAS